MSETEVTTEVQEVDTDNLDTFSNEFFGQNQEAETEDKTKSSDEHVEQEAEQAVDTETQEDQDEPEVTEEAPPPKKKTAQERIDEIVRQREDQKRDFEAQLAKQAADFEAKLAALTSKAEPAREASEPTPMDLLEDGTEKYPLGEFDPQYIKDLTRFTLNQERAQAAKQAEQDRIQEAETREREALLSDWNSRVETAKADYPDLVEKGQTLLNGFNNLDQGYAQYLATVLMSMDKGPDVLYYLSNNPEEATKIVNSGAQKATLALGRIEAKFIEAEAQKVLAKPKISAAPPPPPVRARGTNGAFIAVAPDTDDLDAFSDSFFDKKRGR